MYNTGMILVMSLIYISYQNGIMPLNMQGRS